MAYSRVSYTANGVQTDYTFGFTYLDRSHVKVTVGGVPSTSFTFLDDHTLRFSPAPNGELVIYRATSPEARMVDYEAPSQLNESDLNVDSEQAFLLNQEALDAAALAEEKASHATVRLDDIDGTAAEAASAEARAAAAQTASDRVAVQTAAATVNTKAAAVEAAAAVATASAVTVSADSWAALSLITPSFVGQRAQVSANDAGTHTGRTAASPSADATGVVNKGVYGAYALSAGAWRRDGDLSPVTMASDPQTITGLATDVATSPSNVKKVLDTRFSSLQAVQVAPESGWALPILDANNRVLGGFKLDGRFQAHLSDTSIVPTAALEAGLLNRLIPSTMTWVQLSPESGFIWALVDANSRVVLGITPAGHLKATLAPGVSVSQGDLIPLVAAALEAQKLYPLPAITCWGDSMTAGAGGSGTTYPGVLASLLTSTSVSNQGIGGQTSTQIAARQGGVPIKVTVSGNSIPASGGVAVSAKSVNILYNSSNFVGTSTGKLVGVAGTMTTDTSGNWTFTRSTSGSSVTCPPDSVFYPDTATLHEQNTVIIWAGRNNAVASTVRDDVIGMVSRLTPKNKRVLVLSVCNGSGETTGTGAYNNIAKVNAELARHFGECYVDIRRYLIDFGLAEAGITATSQDTADIAGDTVPASLRYDSVHLLGPGYTIIANLLARILRAKGWI